MAGLGIVPAGLDYRSLCGLYFARHEIRRQRRKELAGAFAKALEGAGEP